MMEKRKFGGFTMIRGILRDIFPAQIIQHKLNRRRDFDLSGGRIAKGAPHEA